MAQARSPWRDEEIWLERLRRDQDLLRERIGQDRMMSLGTFLNVLDGDGWIDFLVVYGKAAREGLEATKTSTSTSRRHGFAEVTTHSGTSRSTRSTRAHASTPTAGLGAGS